jgi:membrane associated rhomboid family serine protease
MTRSEFAGFFIGTASIATYAQVGFDTLTSGDAGTLGVSGAVYAFPAFYAIVGIWSIRDRGRSVNDRPVVLSAIVVVAVIPLLIIGGNPIELEITQAAPTAKFTHGVRYLLGLGYGLYRQ